MDLFSSKIASFEFVPKSRNTKKRLNLTDERDTKPIELV